MGLGSLFMLNVLRGAGEKYSERKREERARAAQERSFDKEQTRMFADWERKQDRLVEIANEQEAKELEKIRTKKINQLKPYVKNDAELAAQLYSENEDNIDQLLENARKYSSIFDNDLTVTADDGTISLNPILNAPSVQDQKEMYTSIFMEKTVSQDLRDNARLNLQQLAFLEDLGKDTEGFTTTMQNALHRSVKNDILAEAKKAAQNDTNIKYIVTDGGDIIPDDEGGYLKWYNENITDIVNRTLQQFSFGDSVNEYIFKVYAPNVVPEITVLGQQGSLSH
jgi:hypothetical protein